MFMPSMQERDDNCGDTRVPSVPACSMMLRRIRIAAWPSGRTLFLSKPMTRTWWLSMPGQATCYGMYSTPTRRSTTAQPGLLSWQKTKLLSEPPAEIPVFADFSPHSMRQQEIKNGSAGPSPAPVNLERIVGQPMPIYTVAPPPGCPELTIRNSTPYIG